MLACFDMCLQNLSRFRNETRWSMCEPMLANSQWRPQIKLLNAFPRKKLHSEKYSLPNFTQTIFFDSALKSEGEIDFVMW